MLDSLALVPLVLIALAALAGGALNAVAGGGSFLLFPAMLFAGLPPREANASTTVSQPAATLAALGGYRDQVRGLGRVAIPMGVASLTGALAGALLLLRTSSATFQRVLPFLLLGATLLFAVGPSLTRRFTSASARDPRGASIVLGCVAQLLIATYGGYFGGGMGILMLATLSLMGMRDLPRMNALKGILGLAINTLASITFLASGVVHYGYVAVAAVAGALGGFAGAKAGTRVDSRYLRAFVVLVGLVLTVRFFMR